uniref:ACB domain-containing protein n=1 Tax=Strix occidentalis caurina TaxID=311401 RepID=A0A8D0FTX2_STROC
ERRGGKGAARPVSEAERSYRPSYEEMLRFYSYYKQATAGCCQGPRPGFWDPIGRYKWDAWHSLGRMSKEEAMAAYVAEMKKGISSHGVLRQGGCAFSWRWPTSGQGGLCTASAGHLM